MNVPLHCINEAAIEYNIPAKLIIAVLETERGKAGQTTQNKNGTYDIGVMAINSIWLPVLKPYGITQQAIQYDVCLNLKVGVWILSKKIAGRDNLSLGVGDYHSHTAKFNTIYYNKVQVNIEKLNIFLEGQI